MSWDRPLLPQAVAFLAGAWSGSGPLDLSHCLVVVPTRQAGRRLREALAHHAATHRSAVFPPRVLTPEAFVARARQGAAAAAGQRPASNLETLLGWIDVFRRVDLTGFREVFPVAPPERSFSWAMRLAEQFQRLQTALGENDLRIADVPRGIGNNFPEADRWRQLAGLEERHDERLREAGVCSPFANVARAGTVSWLPEVERVVMLATVDPMPSVLRILSADPARRPVDVVVFAPAALAQEFDPWGRPLPAAWEKRALELPAFTQRVHLCADPAEQALRVAALAKTYGPPPGERPAARTATPPPGEGAMLAVGLADPELLPLLAAEAARAEVPVFNPEGLPRRSGSLFHFLTALAGCVRTPAFEAVEALARCPDFLDHLARHTPGFSAARLLAGLDELRRRHLPADLAAARQHASAEVALALGAIAGLQRALDDGEFPANLAGVLATVYAGRALDPAREADERLRDAASAWTAVARECAAASDRFDSLTTTEWWELALRRFGESRRSEEKPAGALELQGWLELLFEDAPHLVIAGCNEGMVPEAVSEDPFLPESLRMHLGLRTNPGRFARDAYLLQAVAACRRECGRLDVLFGRTTAAGDPLRPSRLLLRCPDAELPERIAFLFRAPQSTASHLPWQRAWRLTPPAAPAPKKVAVTSLRRWLACPFRFYLTYVLRMGAVDAAKTEMDAFDFGSLCHTALEAMGREPALRDCTDGAVLREFLLNALTREAHAQFGSELSLPLLIQLESARQRLAKFADVQAGERAAGWVIQEVERPFEVEIAGLWVKGKIDRIDRHDETGAVRVLDYKTSDAAVSPRLAHLRALRDPEAVPDWATVIVDGKRRAWADLQLPLYRHALAPAWGNAVACGYVNLPKAVGQTALSLWEDFPLELQADAMRCAEGVCGAITRAEFWPPNEDLRADADEFAALFHHGAAASVEWPAAGGASA